MTKNISLLGSTGSIGLNVLDVVRQNSERVNVVGLAAGRNIKRLKEQIVAFEPQLGSVKDGDLAGDLAQSLPGGWTEKIVVGNEGNEKVATIPSAAVDARASRNTSAWPELGEVKYRPSGPAAATRSSTSGCG